MPDKEKAIRRIEGLLEGAESEDIVMLPVYTTVEVLREALGLLKGPTSGDWVSVKDRLPEAGVKCLIVDGRGYITIGEQIEREKCIWQWQDSDFYARGGITHWMPIPPGPEVSGDA